MQVVGFIVFAVVGVVQFLAVWDALEVAFGLGSVIGLIGAAILAYLPLIGSAVGVYGALEVWDWNLFYALLLFFWFVPFYLIALAVDVVARGKLNG